MEHYLPMKRNESAAFAETWMDIEIQSEVSQKGLSLIFENNQTLCPKHHFSTILSLFSLL